MRPIRLRLDRFRAFLRNRAGATAIEYLFVIGILALGAAGAVAATGGRLQDGYQRVALALEGITTALFGDGWTDLVSTDFSTPAQRQGWACVGHQCRTPVRFEQFGDLGWMMGPYGADLWPNNWLSFPITLSSGSTSALIEFDLLIIDSWDGVGTTAARGGNGGTEGDAVRFRIDNTTFSTQNFIHTGNPVITPGTQPNQFDPSRAEFNRALLNPTRTETGSLAASSYNMTMSLVERSADPTRVHSQSNTARNYEDQVWRVQIEVTNPQPNFTFRLMPTVGQALNDEAMGIANFSVREQ